MSNESYTQLLRAKILNESFGEYAKQVAPKESSEKTPQGENFPWRTKKSIDYINLSGLKYTPAGQYIRNLLTRSKSKSNFKVYSPEQLGVKSIQSEDSKLSSTIKRFKYTPVGQLATKTVKNIKGALENAYKGYANIENTLGQKLQNISQIAEKGKEIAGEKIEQGAKIAGRGIGAAAKKAASVVTDELRKTSNQADNLFLKELREHEIRLHQQYADHLGMRFNDYTAILRNAPQQPPVPVSIDSPNYKEDLKEYENQKKAWNNMVTLHMQIKGIHEINPDLHSRAREIERHKQSTMDSLDKRTGGKWKSYTPPLWADNDITRHLID
jgi:F0F1-type ATP synthase membrane subunit b/b'